MKTLLYTGARSGIAINTINKIINDDFYIYLTVHTDKQLEYIKEKYKDKKNIKCLKLDITNKSDRKILEELDIDVLVNNAGISKDNFFLEKSSDEFKEVLDVNLVGTFLVSKYVSKHMLEQQEGTIINVSSNNGINANYPESMDYDASKAGIISLTHNFSLALKPYVRVNCVCPGWMNTDMNKDIDEDFKKEEEKKIYLNRFGNAEEVANVIYFLATPNASYVNNSIIKVDGGTNV